MPAQTFRTASADECADVIVVGAGFTGIAAARRYAARSPAARILLLDASTVGEGNAGRNSGFLLEVALAHDVDTASMQRMRVCNDLLQETMRDLANDVQQAAIDCDLQRSGTFRGAAGSHGLRALAAYQAFLEEAGLPVEYLDKHALAQRTGSEFYQAGLYSPHCYLVQPAALIRGLADLLPSNVTLYENTPATNISTVRDQWRVNTPQASLTAPQVIIANNAFCKGLGIGRSRLTAMYTYAALTKPLSPEQLQHCGTETSWGLLPAHRLGSTLRRTNDGRLLIRSLYGYEREAAPGKVAGRLQTALQRRFPQLGTLPFDAVWSGATGFTYNGAPLWGELQPGLYVSAGCNGGGVVKGSLFGRLLSDLAHGVDTPDVATLFGSASWMPPEPFRRLGFELISRIERFRGRAEV